MDRPSLSTELRTLAEELSPAWIVSTHWVGCHTTHTVCALIKAAERIELLERSLKVITTEPEC